MKSLSLTLLFTCFLFWATAQKKIELNFSAYIDYYASSFDNESTDINQPLTTVGARPARFRKNISLLGINLKHKYFRAQFTSHSGRIVDATWDSETPGIQEAYAGLHLFPDLYVDAGYFTTHIGMESFMPKENLLSSTSIITYNEPFYQRGARVVYEGLKNYEFQLWLLDGYNLFRDNNNSKSIGLLASYEKGDLVFSYSNILGQEPVSAMDDAFRTYHNLYTNYTFLRDIFELRLSTDFATQTSVGNIEAKTMFACIAAIRVNITPRLSTTFRYEYQNDKQDMIGGSYPVPGTTVGLVSGINMDGYTFGVAYELKGLYLRYEVRNLADRQNSIAVFGNSSKRSEQLFTIGFAFDTKLKT